MLGSSRRPGLLSWLWDAAAAALILGTVVGVTVGLARGWKYVQAGVPRALAFELALTVDRSVLAALAFALVYVLALSRAVRAGHAPRAAGVLACAIAAMPLFLLAAREVNRANGITLSMLAHGEGKTINAQLAVAAVAAFAVAALATDRWLTRRLLAGRRARPALVAALLLVPLGGNAAMLLARASASDRPNVLVILIDALRYDHLGCYGYGRETSPEIDALARDAVLFEQAISQSTFTKTSIASLFTSRWPHQHGVYWGGTEDDDGSIVADSLRHGEQTLAEVLRDHGYLTSAWVRNAHLRAHTGFAQGFVDYRDRQGTVEDINRRFVAWTRGAGRAFPFFSYLHYLDVHGPYRPPPPFDTMFGVHGDPYSDIDLAEWGAHLAQIRAGAVTPSPHDVEAMKALYDGQVRRVDEGIGALMRALKRAGLYDGMLIVLTADHGDGFMEHGFISHSFTPYEELVRVPLLVKFPHSRHAGRTIERQVRLVDVFATILDVAGIAPPHGIVGCSLRRLLGAGTDEDGCFDYALTEIAHEGGAPTVAVRTERFKYIARDKQPAELYDLAADPGETRNVIASVGPDEARELRRIAAGVTASRIDSDDGRARLDDEMVERLKALGYVP